MDKLKPTNRDKANVEAEKGETVVTKFFQDLFPEHYEIDGKKHKDGGTPLSLPQGSFIFSNAPEMKIKDKKVLDYLGEKKAKTIAEIAKKYDLNKFKKILTDKNASPINRNSALVGMSNNLEKLGFLALYQEMMKGLPDGVPEISQEFLNKNPEYVDKINEILSKEKNTGTDEQQVPQAFMGMSFTANDFNDGPSNRKRKKSDDYVSEKLEPKPLDFSSLFKTNQSEQEEREISTNPSNTTPNNQQNNIDNQTPVRKYLGPPYHLESFLASKKQEILKDPIRGSYNPEISVKEKPTPDFPPNEYSPDGPWADPLSDTFRNTPAEKLETRSVFDQKTDQETQELKKSGLDKEFEENYKKIKEKSDEIDDKYYEKNIKKMTKEELKKLREDLESGKLKATVKNYNMSLVFPGGYQSMLMDKAMANWASWLEGNLQSAYASPVYNANRVYGAQQAMNKGDYVQSGTRTGDFKPDRNSLMWNYGSFGYPYYPVASPQMAEGGQVNKFDPGMALKEIYEQMGYSDKYAEGGETPKKQKENKQNDNSPEAKLDKTLFNTAVNEAYDDLRKQLPDLVDSIYDKVYKDKKHTDKEKETAKNNIEKLIISSFNATKKGLYDADYVSFSKQSEKSTARTSKLDNELKDLAAKGDKEAIKRYVETAMKINAVNNISNTNPQIFTNPEIRKSLESGNALMNKDAAAKLRKEYFDAWNLPNYGDPTKVKDDLGVALFQYSFNRNKDIDDDNLVLTSKDYQDGSNVYYKRPKEFRQGLKSKDNISAVDGYYGDRTQNQFMLDLSVFAEPTKETPKTEPAKKEEQTGIAKEESKIEKPKIEEPLGPKLKARGYYFLQDKNRIAQALHNLYSIKKRPPYEPEPMVTLPDYSLLDPNRALQANQQAYKMGMEQVGAYLPPQVAAAQAAVMSGQAATDAANIISDTQNKNVGIANQASVSTASLINDYLQRKQNQMRSLHDKYTIMEERYTADRNKALANLTDAINNAITNAAKTQTINEILYKDSPYYVEPETGGTTHFDPRYAKDITMTAKKDRTTMMNELMGKLRSHGIETDKMTPEQAEKWLNLYGISDVSGSELIEPSVKKQEKETFTPWWQMFPFNSKKD